MVEHISYSALKLFNECPQKYKLMYVDGIEKSDNTIHTVFGTSIHSAVENKLKDRTNDEVRLFEESFLKESKILKNLKQEEYNEFANQGKMLAPLALPVLESFFGEFELLAAEEEIYEKLRDINNNSFHFKGFIDLTLKTKKDNKINILDIKTCGWGWRPEKKSSAIITYQLTLYKHFYSQKYKIDEKDIETYFMLLKRIAKNDNIEIFRVTSGQKKTENALKLVDNCLKYIEKGFYPKNRTNCIYCKFFKTEHCR